MTFLWMEKFAAIKNVQKMKGLLQEKLWFLNDWANIIFLLSPALLVLEENTVLRLGEICWYNLYFWNLEFFES